MSETTVEKFSFDVDFQKEVLKLLIDDVNFLIKSAKYLKKEYFSTDILQWIFEKIVWYYTTYQKTITHIVFMQEIMGLKENELEYTALVRSIFSIEVKEKEYIIKKIEEFIKRNITVKGLEKVASLYNSGHFDDSLSKMSECLSDVNRVSFEAPHRSFFFEETNDRISRRNNKLLNVNYRFTTGILELDSYLNGGLSKGELGVVVADAKVGKSIFLMNVGVSVIRTFGGKVLHINLEGKDGQTDDRYESRLLLHNYKDIIRNNLPNSMYKEYERFGNDLVISNFLTRWDYTVADIEQEILDLRAYNFIPDVIIVDYGDLLVPMHTSRDDSYKGQEECFRGLKTLATKYDCAVWTASQVHRVGKDVKPQEDMNFYFTRQNLADSYSKIRIADLMITLNMTNEEQKNKRCRVYIDGYRDSLRGQLFSINTNYEKMHFAVPNSTSYDMLNKSHIEG